MARKPFIVYFGVFLLFVALGSYFGNINSSLLGIDMTTADDSIVGIGKIAVWSIGFGWLIYGVRSVK